MVIVVIVVRPDRQPDVKEPRCADQHRVRVGRRRDSFAFGSCWSSFWSSSMALVLLLEDRLPVALRAGPSPDRRPASELSMT